jgi:heavy metal sensor kinase
VNLQWPARIGTRLALSYVLLTVAAMILFTAGTAAVLFVQMRSQLAHFAVQDIETVEGLLQSTPTGNVKVRDDYHNHSESKLIPEHYLELRSPDGAVLYRNDRLGSRSIGGASTSDEGVGGYSQRSGALSDGTRVVMVSRRHLLEGRPILIRLAQSEEPVWHALDRFLIAAGLMFPVMIAASAAAGYRVSRRILAPIQSIAGRAERITSSRLHERIPVQGTGDELDHLAEVFNRTLARLDDSFRQLRQFTSDASHELRTPLAAIRAIGEVGLEQDGSKQEYRELVGSMLEEVTRLTRLVDDLLMISRGDSGAIQLSCSAVGVLNLTRDTVALLEPLAEEKEQRLLLSGDAGAIVQADAVLLRQALVNIVHNAIKYSPKGATIALEVKWEPADSVVVSVRDEGPGIAPEHAARIFDRFYRVDSGRSREAGGSGLGLAIAQWVVQAHQGSVAVHSAPGDGSVFRITLPVSGHGGIAESRLPGFNASGVSSEKSVRARDGDTKVIPGKAPAEMNDH